VGIGDSLTWDDTGKSVNKTAAKEVGLALSSTGAGSAETSVLMLLVQTIRGGTGS
jgi:hypothetical protein